VHGSVPASARGRGARAILDRAAGPPRAERGRSRYGLPRLEVLTVRLLVLGVVVLLAAVLLVPTVRAAVQQQMELHQVRTTLEQRQAESAALQRELERWDDPAYVEGQARDKLQYAMPGDHVWRTVGGEEIVEDLDPVTGRPVDDGVVGALTGGGTPWYAALWESVRTADGPPEPEPEPEPAGDGGEPSARIGG